MLAKVAEKRSRFGLTSISICAGVLISHIGLYFWHAAAICSRLHRPNKSLEKVTSAEYEIVKVVYCRKDSHAIILSSMPLI